MPAIPRRLTALLPLLLAGCTCAEGTRPFLHAPGPPEVLITEECVKHDDGGAMAPVMEAIPSASLRCDLRLQLGPDASHVYTFGHPDDDRRPSDLITHPDPPLFAYSHHGGPYRLVVITAQGPLFTARHLPASPTPDLRAERPLLEQAHELFAAELHPGTPGGTYGRAPLLQHVHALGGDDAVKRVLALTTGAPLNLPTDDATREVWVERARALPDTHRDDLRRALLDHVQRGGPGAPQALARLLLLDERALAADQDAQEHLWRLASSLDPSQPAPDQQLLASLLHGDALAARPQAVRLACDLLQRTANPRPWLPAAALAAASHHPDLPLCPPLLAWLEERACAADTLALLTDPAPPPDPQRRQDLLDLPRRLPALGGVAQANTFEPSAPEVLLLAASLSFNDPQARALTTRLRRLTFTRDEGSIPCQDQDTGARCLCPPPVWQPALCAHDPNDTTTTPLLPGARCELRLDDATRRLTFTAAPPQGEPTP